MAAPRIPRLRSVSDPRGSRPDDHHLRPLQLAARSRSRQAASPSPARAQRLALDGRQQPPVRALLTRLHRALHPPLRLEVHRDSGRRRAGGNPLRPLPGAPRSRGHGDRAAAAANAFGLVPGRAGPPPVSDLRQEGVGGARGSGAPTGLARRGRGGHVETPGVIWEQNGRLTVGCDNCPIRLDLGLATAVRARNRTPSGWIRTGPDQHYCPKCSPHVTMAALLARSTGSRPQPLL